MKTEMQQFLISTNTLEIAPDKQPFWYTSGTIGPLYLNTHYLYGNRQKAEELLAFIDAEKDNRKQFLPLLLAQVERNFSEDKVYCAVVNYVSELIQQNIKTDEFEYISGGERRDWFFSLMVAKQLGKKMLVIFKDQTVYSISLGNNNAYVYRETQDLHGLSILHIADLVTEASSYVRSWVPAIEERGGKLKWAVNVVDRGLGGEKKLASLGIDAWHIVRLDSLFFESLRDEGHIGKEETQILCSYQKNPQESMKLLLKENPQIIRDGLHSTNERTRKRAQLFIQQNPYRFSREFLENFS